MKQKTLYIYGNGVVIARLHNRRITVVDLEDERLLIQFARYAPNEKPNPGETFERGIITKHIIMSKEASQGLAQAIFEIHKQQNK